MKWDARDNRIHIHLADAYLCLEIRFEHLIWFDAATLQEQGLQAAVDDNQISHGRTPRVYGQDMLEKLANGLHLD
jgi:hypothetical protein